MEKRDHRKMSEPARHALREVGISLYKQGHSRTSIAATLGVHLNTVCNWVNRYRHEGEAGLAYKRVEIVAPNKLLTIAQEQEIAEVVSTKMPDEFDLAYALWTCRAVSAYILKQYGITISHRAVCNYLNKWGFTPQRPAKRAYEQSPEKVKRWKDETYPELEAQAKKK